MKTRTFTMRIPIDLHSQYIKIALTKGKKQNKIISLSEVIIEALENQLKTFNK